MARESEEGVSAGRWVNGHRFAMSESFEYDVFLSHSSLDKPAVRELADRLKNDGLRVWFDEWELEPGDPILHKIDQGLESSRVLVLVMSAQAMAAPDWATLESHTLIFRDSLNAERRFIPLRLDDAPIKDALRQFLYVDWRERSPDEYTKLLAACRPPRVATPAVVETPGPASLNDVRVLKGHTRQVFAVAMVPDGSRAVSGSGDNTVRVWDLASGRCLATVEGHTRSVFGVAVTTDGSRAVSGSSDKTVRVWDLTSGDCLATLEAHTNEVNCVAVTPDSSRAVSGSDDKTMQVWDLASGRLLATLKEHTGPVYGVAVMPDGSRAVSGSADNTVRVWDLTSGRCLATLEGHTDVVTCVAVTPDSSRAVSGSSDNTVRVWDLASGRCLATLEGHTNIVWSVAVTPDGSRAISGSADNTVRVWDLASGRYLATLEGHTDTVYGAAVTPDGSRAVSGSKDNTVRVWTLPKGPAGTAQANDEAVYTNAKVLLVGDSGVGKSGLAIRLTEDRFEPTISTDGVWATQLKLPHEARPGEREREIWLWDFAGQADYRLIHQLFLDETALAVLVFNPQSDNPFEGLGQWDHDLQRAARRPFRKLLVAGRCDRGGLRVSRASLDQFRKDRGFDAYLETSAQTASGCPELRAAIFDTIPWDQIPWTASPRIFRLLKETILKLKDEGKVLLRLAELRQQLEMRLPGETFTVDELRAVVGLLAGPGLVWRLEFGDFILLQPERVNAYAAAVVRKVRAHTDEIGVIAEEDVLTGKLDYQDMQRLPPDEESIVLRAMHQTFVDHSLCLREPAGAGPLLVFPSYFKRERPDLGDHPAVFVSYRFRGPLEEIYATLVVRLLHTAAVNKDRLWKFAADFKTHEGRRAGLKMAPKGEGSAEISIYFEAGIPDDTKVTFIKYVHEHLKAKAVDVVRQRHYVCPNPKCGEPVEGLRAVKTALERGNPSLRCQFCGKKIPLVDLIEQKFASPESAKRVRELDEQAQTIIDNESRELILVGHAFAIAGEAGQIFRPTPNSDWGIDGEIEFKNYAGEASGQRVYLQLKSGDSYLSERKKDGAEIFAIKNPRHADYWQQQAYRVMLVIRKSDGSIRWMDISSSLKEASRGGKKSVKQVVFDGEPFTALNLQRMRERLIPRPPELVH